jgi:hypothetical protein
MHPSWSGSVKKKEQAVQIQINVLCGFPSKRFFRLLFRPLVASYVFFLTQPLTSEKLVLRTYMNSDWMF